jgi:hypothetical protein
VVLQLRLLLPAELRQLRLHDEQLLLRILPDARRLQQLPDVPPLTVVPLRLGHVVPLLIRLVVPIPIPTPITVLQVVMHGVLVTSPATVNVLLLPLLVVLPQPEQVAAQAVALPERVPMGPAHVAQRFLPECRVTTEHAAGAVEK